MGRFLKKAKTAEDRRTDDKATRDTVEVISLDYWGRKSLSSCYTDS